MENRECCSDQEEKCNSPRSHTIQNDEMEKNSTAIGGICWNKI